jgi:hypothetical protein
MIDRQKCIGCMRLSPETNGESTLTSSHGWRIRRAVDAAGNSSVEWRCAACWQRFKAQQQAAAAAPPNAPSTPGPSSGPDRKA